MRKFLNWLFSHGVAMAYAFLISVSLAAATVVMLVVVLICSWIDRVR